MENIKRITRITWREFLSSLDISNHRYPDNFYVEDTDEEGIYRIELSAHEVVTLEPSIYVKDADNGVVVDREGNEFQIIDWNDDIPVYVFVSLDKHFQYYPVYPYYSFEF